MTSTCRTEEKADCKSAAQDAPLGHPGLGDTYLQYYGIPDGSLTPTRCVGDLPVCQDVKNPPDANSCPAGCTYENAFLADAAVFASDRDKANQAIWDFYQLSFKNRFAKAVGFGTEEGDACIEQVDVNTEETVRYCAPNPDKGVKYIALEYSVDLKRRAYYPETEFRQK